MTTNGDFVTVLQEDVTRIENGNNIPGERSSDSEREVVKTYTMESSKYDEVNGEQAALAQADWRQPTGDGHDDFYLKFLRNIYFPFYAKYHVHICCAWLAIFIVCIIFGPAFLSSTRSNLDLPDGTPSAAAVKAFQDNYPSASRSLKFCDIFGSFLSYLMKVMNAMAFPTPAGPPPSS
jgi:hypothetical protein